MNAHYPYEALPFSKEEMLSAMRLVVGEEQALEMAEAWDAISDKMQSGEAIGWSLTESTFILLSLLGEETALRVEREYLVGLSSEERKRFELQRDQIRASLENDGKL